MAAEIGSSIEKADLSQHNQTSTYSEHPALPIKLFWSSGLFLCFCVFSSPPVFMRSCDMAGCGIISTPLLATPPLTAPSSLFISLCFSCSHPPPPASCFHLTSEEQSQIFQPNLPLFWLLTKKKKPQTQLVINPSCFNFFFFFAVSLRSPFIFFSSSYHWGLPNPSYACLRQPLRWLPLPRSLPVSSRTLQ